jgi:hypothetical protein
MEAGRGTARERREDGADDHISAQRGSKVFELLEGGAAARKAGRRKVNVFATLGRISLIWLYNAVSKR